MFFHLAPMPSNSLPTASAAPVWWPAVSWVVVAAGTLVNVLLGALDAPLHIREDVKWGVYAAEYMTLVIWCSWGTGSQVFRLIAGIVVGALWMPASWIGYWIASPDRMGHYTHEMQQMLTVVPPAFVISMVPLCVMRWCGWRFFSPQSPVPRASPLAWIILVAFVIGMLACFSVDRWAADDLVLSRTVGLLLGAVVAIVAPCFTLAFLGTQLKVQWILLALILVPVPGLGFASQFAMPGPGANAVFAYGPALVASLSSMVPVTIAFWVLRIAGLRYRGSMPVDALRSRKHGQEEPSDAAESR